MTKIFPLLRRLAAIWAASPRYHPRFARARDAARRHALDHLPLPCAAARAQKTGGAPC